MVADQAEIREESRRARRLQVAVDLVSNVIRQSDLPFEEAEELVAATRQFALRLFPERESTYDLIYQPRLRRLMIEKYRIV
jgi:hypothetical protein